MVKKGRIEMHLSKIAQGRVTYNSVGIRVFRGSLDDVNDQLDAYMLKHEYLHLLDSEMCVPPYRDGEAPEVYVKITFGREG